MRCRRAGAWTSPTASERGDRVLDRYLFAARSVLFHAHVFVLCVAHEHAPRRHAFVIQADSEERAYHQEKRRGAQQDDQETHAARVTRKALPVLLENEGRDRQGSNRQRPPEIGGFNIETYQMNDR